MPPMATSAQIRQQLVEDLELDLIGPDCWRSMPSAMRRSRRWGCRASGGGGRAGIPSLIPARLSRSDWRDEQFTTHHDSPAPAGP